VLLLYDVMGHSLETTEINAMAARIVGEHGEMSGSGRVESERMSPKTLVNLLNKSLFDAFGGQGIFLTMLCTLFDLEKETLTYTCAGHEPPFLVLDDGKAASLLNTQLVVGIDPDFPYREYDVPFGSGNILCVFSDGIVEATDRNGEYFGRAGVKRVLEGNRGTSPRAVLEALLREVDRFAGGKPIEDEISMIVVESKGE
jgi:sigma-B regulation protein RsbU (phosphoserine phosphatase)